MTERLVHTTTGVAQLLGEELQQAAKAYREQGFSVIPLAGKLPLIPWKEFQSRRATEAEVAAWFSIGDKRITGVGIVTGKIFGLVVVDCDRPEDAEYWQENYPATGVVADSGGGGTHFYYAMPVDDVVRNRAGILGRKIDIRGEGGFICAPPSRHPCGKHYAFAACEWNGLTKFDAAWLVRSEPGRVIRSTPETQQIRNAVAYIHKIQAVAGEGGHNKTFRAACKLRDAGLSSEEALTILSQWNETNASPPWTDSELEHKIKSAYGTLMQ